MPEAMNDMGNDIEESRWQFMITGGIDFGMPLTVFQVTEGGKADRVGLKLGDSILQINEQDTTDMALQDAQKMIEISSNSQLKLKVQNVDDEEETGHAEVRDILLMTEKKPKQESKDGTPQPNLPDSLEEQLKAMQQRLSELALIPDQIQETLMNVAKTMQKFLPPGSIIVTDPVETIVEEIDQYDDSYRFDEKAEEVEAAGGDQTDDDLGDGELDGEEKIEGASGGSLEDCTAEGFVDGPEEKEEEEPEPEKENPFERKWPWTSQERNTFKRSNFQGYRSSSMIQNRIKQLNAKDLFATYRRNQANIGN